MYNLYMAKSDTWRVTLSAAVPKEMIDAIKVVAKATDRSRSQVCEKLLRRGLAAYARDGRLDEPTLKLPPDPYEGATFPDDVAEYDDNPPGWER